MINLKIESWSAIAPGMENTEAWSDWLGQNSRTLTSTDTKLSLKQVPPLLRRRFTTLGKYAARAALDLLKEDVYLPKVFASRHGDTELTFSLLEEIAKKESISPIGFSLAVHNAIGGLISIAREDAAPMTAIASMDSLLLDTFHEATAQLEAYEKVLCVIYDAALPDIYLPYCQSLPFPFAIAFVVTKNSGTPLVLQKDSPTLDKSKTADDDDVFDFVSLLLGLQSDISLYSGKHAWRLSLTQTS